MEEAITVALAVKQLETWMTSTGGRAEVRYEPRGTFGSCPVVTLFRGDRVVSEGCGLKYGSTDVCSLAHAIAVAVERAAVPTA